MFNSPLQPVVRVRREPSNAHPFLLSPPSKNKSSSFDLKKNQRSITFHLIARKFRCDASRHILDNSCYSSMFHSRLAGQLQRQAEIASANSSMLLDSPLTPIKPSNMELPSPSKAIRKQNLKMKQRGEPYSFHFKHSIGLSSLSFVPTGNSFCQQLVAGDKEGNIIVFSISEDLLVGYERAIDMLPSVTCKIPSQTFINRMSTTRNGKCWVACDDSTLYCIDLNREGHVQRFEGHTSFLSDVKKNSSEELILSSSLDTTAKIWNESCFHPIFSLNLKESVNSCCWLPNSNNMIYTTSNINSIKLWDLRKCSTYVCELIQKGNYKDFQPAAVADYSSEDSDDSYSGMFGSWNTPKKKVKRPKSEPVALYGDGVQCNTQEYFDPFSQTYQEPFFSHKPSENVFDIQCSNDHPSCLISSSLFSNKIWSTTNHKGICSLTSSYKKYNADQTSNEIAVIPAVHNQVMVSGCKNGNIYIWNSITRAENTSKRANYSYRIERAHETGVRALCISSQGDMLASTDLLGNLSVVSMYDSPYMSCTPSSSLNTSFDSSIFEVSPRSTRKDSLSDEIFQTPKRKTNHKSSSKSKKKKTK